MTKTGGTGKNLKSGKGSISVNKNVILLIEDEEKLSRTLAEYLELNGYRVLRALNGLEGLSMFYDHMHEVDLILLDIMLPDEDGVSILKKLKSRPDTENIPVIMMTAKSSEYDKVLGLDSGADDYITKPFGVMELISRVKAVIRRSDRSKGSAGEVLKIGELVLDEQKHEVYARGQEVSLTFKEFELLSYLMKNRGLVLSRDKILHQRAALRPYLGLRIHRRHPHRRRTYWFPATETWDMRRFYKDNTRNRL